MNSKDIKEFENLTLLMHEIQDARQLECFKQFKKLNSPRIIFSIYQINHIDLKKELNRYYNIALDDTIIRRTGQRRLVKSFHNVLASLRVYTDKYVDDYLEDDFHCFMKELRNYSIHHDFFPLSSRLKFDRHEDVRYESIQIPKIEKYLVESIELSKNKKQGLKRALAFLYSQKSEIILNELFEEYFIKLKKHYKQYISHQVCSNSHYFKDLQKLNNSLIIKSNNTGVRSPNLLSSVESRYLSYLINTVL